jgi:hypothetical protein
LLERPVRALALMLNEVANQTHLIRSFGLLQEKSQKTCENSKNLFHLDLECLRIP